jgi:hypothetical protein
MESKLVKVALTSVLVFATSCGDDDKEKETKYEPSTSRVIYVTGDEGVTFTGALGSLGSTSSVEGTTPKEFPFEYSSGGNYISATLQKDEDDDKTLRVECYISGTKREEATTTAAFGVVSVSCGSMTMTEEE